MTQMTANLSPKKEHFPKGLNGLKGKKIKTTPDSDIKRLPCRWQPNKKQVLLYFDFLLIIQVHY